MKMLESVTGTSILRKKTGVSGEPNTLLANRMARGKATIPPTNTRDPAGQTKLVGVEQPADLG
jgi:hypothetical protein